MPGSEASPARGDIVRVPFPYTDGTARQHRPALVIARSGPASGFLLWVLMITSAANRGWPGDVTIPDHDGAGLPAPSLVRTAKTATIEASRAEVRGRLPDAVLAQVMAEVRARIG
jgi:mRNA interferase MazF